MAGLLELERWCNALPDRIDKAANQLAFDVTENMAKYLINITPVDVTTATSNWQASLNLPPSFWMPAIFPGERGSTATSSRRAALNHVVRVLLDKNPGEPVYLSNLTPYIIDLNNGSSPQARAGWIDAGFRYGQVQGAALGLRITK